MSIDTELARLTNAKAAIKAAIEGKGVTVPEGTLLDGMASLIEAIEAGGGNSNFISGSFTPNESVYNYTINHELGEIPNVYAVWTDNIDGNQTLLTLKCIILLCPNITDTNGYVGYYNRCGKNSTYDSIGASQNAGRIVTDSFLNTDGLLVYNSNETSCDFSIKFGTTTKVYFYEGYTYKYLIGRCEIA